MGNQIAIPHALWLLLQGINMLAARDPLPSSFAEDRAQLPVGVCWTPEGGNIRLKDYMELNGQLFHPQCLRSLTRHTIPATQPPELEATQPFRLLARCRIMFVTGAKSFQVEQMVPVEAVTSLWKGSIQPETEGWQIDDQDQDRFFLGTRLLPPGQQMTRASVFPS